MTNTIPLIFGITGHRDLRDEDMPYLKERVSEIFQTYQKRYPNTKIILLSALAEGADILVAEVARELGITLHVVLPYKEASYLKNSFSDEACKEQFRVLKAYASACKTLPCGEVVESTSHCYQKLGEYIADISNILIALWDGTESGKPGGTAAIVRYMRTGVEENRFDQQDGNALYIINTPRKINQTIENPYHVTKEFLGVMKEAEFEAMLKKIDTVNREVEKQKPSDTLLTTYRDYFRNKAAKAQADYKRAMFWILLLGWISIACMESLHVLHEDRFLWGYGVAVFLAFGVYHLFVKKRNIKDNFIYSRGLSEALRVQNAWSYAGIEKPVAKYYLQNHHHKFTWLRNILKNLYYLHIQKASKIDACYVKEVWIAEQISYMKNASITREKKLYQSEKIEKWFYNLGAVIFAMLFIWFVLEQFHIIAHGILPFSWHHLVLVSSLLFVTTAFIGEKYLKIEAYKEDIYHFKVMIQAYQKAQKLLADKKLTIEAYQKIIFDLGEKALDENSKWVVLHDSRHAEPSFE